MKKEIVILYVIAAIQFLITLFSFTAMKQGFYYAGKGLIEICDQRYVQK